MTWSPWLPVHESGYSGPRPYAVLSGAFTRYHPSWAQPQWRYHRERGYVQYRGLVKVTANQTGRPDILYCYADESLAFQKPTARTILRSIAAFGTESNDMFRIDLSPTPTEGIHHYLYAVIDSATIPVGQWCWLGSEPVSLGPDPEFSAWQPVHTDLPGSAVRCTVAPRWAAFGDANYHSGQWRVSHDLNRWQLRGLLTNSGGALGQAPPFDLVLTFTHPRPLVGNILIEAMAPIVWAGGSAASMRMDAKPDAAGHSIQLVSAKAVNPAWLNINAEYTLRRT